MSSTVIQSTSNHLNEVVRTDPETRSRQTKDTGIDGVTLKVTGEVTSGLALPPVLSWFLESSSRI